MGAITYSMQKERAALLEAEPGAATFLHPFVGAREYLQGGERWILALHEAAPGALARLPRVRERIAAVRAPIGKPAIASPRKNWLLKRRHSIM